MSNEARTVIKILNLENVTENSKPVIIFTWLPISSASGMISASQYQVHIYRVFILYRR